MMGLDVPFGSCYVVFCYFGAAAYKYADGKKINDKRVVVDVERGRTVKGWRPRRLGKFFDVILSYMCAHTHTHTTHTHNMYYHMCYPHVRQEKEISIVFFNLTVSFPSFNGMYI